MSLVQQLLMRALVARFWTRAVPAASALARWGTELHDRFMLPHFVWEDLARRRRPSCATFGYRVRARLVRAAPRVPLPAARRVRRRRRRGRAAQGARALARARRGERRRRHRALRRFVARARRGQGHRPGRRPPRDHLQRPARAAAADRHASASSSPACATAPGSRRRRCIRPSACMRRWCSTWSTPGCGRSLGGCQYHVAHPGGLNYDDLPGQRLRGRGRRLARFFRIGHTPGAMTVPQRRAQPRFPAHARPAPARHE